MWPTSPCSGDAHAARGGPAALQRPPRARRRLLQGGRASYQADVCGWISSRGRPARRRACRAAERVDHGRRSASPSWCVGELPAGGHGGGISGAGGRGREGRASELRSEGEGAHTAPHGRLTSCYQVGNGPTAHGCRGSELVPLARPPARRSCEAGRQSGAASRALAWAAKQSAAFASAGPERGRTRSERLVRRLGECGGGGGVLRAVR